VLFRSRDSRPPRPHHRHDGPLPIYTILVPLFHEAAVLPDLVAAVRALNYPTDRLDVKLILEADDTETIAAAHAMGLGAPFDVLHVPRGAPRTKPRALNYALAFARGAFVVIYDAEDRPHPDQLTAALDAFDAQGSKLACVQAPLFWYNATETWLTRQFALEYAALFHVILPALARWGWPLPLGGTSNHFRRTALDAAGGWDPHNVTEDADLGFRLAELGFRAGVITPPTGEEAVTTLAPWRRQRSRWIKGFLQTLFVRLRNLTPLTRASGLGGLASLTLTIALPIASSFLHGPIAILALLGLALGWLGPTSIAFLVAGYAIAAVTALIGLKRSEQLGLAPAILTMPLYWPLQSIAAVKSVADLIYRPFHWEKTRHGVTRLSPTSTSANSALSGELTGAAVAPEAAQQPHERNAHQTERSQEGDAADDEPERVREHADKFVDRVTDGRERALT